METQNKTAEELREENIRSIVEQVEIWQKTDKLNRTAIIILEEDISVEKTKCVNMVYGLGINVLSAFKHFIKSDAGKKLMGQLAKINLIQKLAKDE